MRKTMKQVILLTAGSLLAAASVMLTSCGETDAKQGTASVAQKQDQAITVRIEEVQLSPFADVIQVAGIVKAYEDIMLSPEEGGVVKEWLVRKGQSVKKGQILGVLNDDVLKASYDAAQAQYKLAELNFQKQLSVYKEKAISEIQFKNFQYTRDAAKAQANLMRARLDRTRLRSPINGIFNDTFADEGEFAPPALPVAHLVNLRAIKIQAEISERYAGNVSIGNLATIVSEAIPGDTLQGRIIFVGAAVSASNRTLPVEIAIPNPELKLKPEMIARVSIVRSERVNAILVSEDIIQQVDRGKMVVFVERDGVAEQRIVKVGARQGSLVEVVDGLHAGDRIIVSGFRRLVDGQPVVIAG